MGNLYNTVFAKGVAALLTISVIAPATVFAADTAAVPAKAIGVEAAEEAAIKDAGVKMEEITGIHAHLEKDDGKYVYDVDFYVGDVKYEYEINAEDGKILEKDKEVKKSSAKTVNKSTDKADAGKTTGTKDAKTAAETFIEIEEAKKIALKDAGLKEDEVTFCTVEFDNDGRIPEYEIEFFKGKMEYEYDIDAVTGEILNSSSEIDD